MNRAALARFSRRAAANLSEALGVSIQVGSVTLDAFVSWPSVGLDLESGGLRTTRQLKARWPLARCAPPSIGTTLILLEEQITYEIETVQTLRGSALGQEVHVTAIRQ